MGGAQHAGQSKKKRRYTTRSSITLSALTSSKRPSYIYAFTPRHPQGVKVLQLGADEGIVERWMTVDNTLWLSTQDFRDPKHRKSFAFSLDLHKVLAD